MTEPNGLYPKIARIMGKLNRLPKTGSHAHFKYKFVTDADVADAVRKELSAENVAFFASMISSAKEGKRTVAEFEFTFACGDTGNTQVCKWVGEADDSQDKGLSKAATSAEKYFLLKTFMLSTGDKIDDPDSGEDRPPTTQRQQSASEPPPSELDEHFGAKTQRTTDNVTPENVLFTASSWGPISRRLATAGLVNHVDHAFNRLAKIVKKELGEGNAINLAATAKWTEADVIAKFEARIAEKANES